jgi:transcriptional regulator with PAS, ATPase and Fis domain
MENKSNSFDFIDNIPREMLFQLLDNPLESLIVVDEKGLVLFMSKAYEQISSMSVSEAIGKHVTEVSPTTKVHKVLESGKAEIGEPFFIKGKLRIVARIPIKKNNKIIGAYGKLIFWHSEKVKYLYDQINKLKGEIKHYKDQIIKANSSQYSLNDIVGESYPLKIVKEQALQVADTDSTVLITGESGTGKELFAHSIHYHSSRSAYPFVSINCSCIPKELAESVMFGYAPGAFTGATKNGQIGKFELADKGTIFLDEIGDMPMNIQVKLLRFIQEKQIEKIGGKPMRVDCRIIAATNRDLEELVKQGAFRSDLYYRLNVVNISLPPLRQMKSDIPLLVHYFVAKLTQNIPKKISSITPEAMNALIHYHWPGNIRELENLLEGAIIFCKGTQIDVEHLPPRLIEKNEIKNNFNLNIKSRQDLGKTLKEQMQLIEKQIILNTLKMTDNDVGKASEMLGIHRSGLYKKLKIYGICGSKPMSS